MAEAALADPRQRSADSWIAGQRGVDLLRFMTCGSVDDGKSTLIGRLLWESRNVADDQLAALRLDSKRYGTQGDELDFALLVDGLSAEREQNITIDVAHRYFATGRRKFIVADTPGHEQYTRNTVTAASTADAAVLLVDAQHGLTDQTRRHAYLVSLFGVREVVLAVNKMDLVDYDAASFGRTSDAFTAFASPLGLRTTAIPVSALKGDNVTAPSRRMSWYAGPTLLAFLETVEIPRSESHRLVFPVQWVNRPNARFRGFSGSVASGCVRVGDTVRVTASGRTAHVSEIVTMDGPLSQADAGRAVTLKLDEQIDCSRGDVLSLADAPLEMTDHFEASLVWLHETPGFVGRTYDLKLASQWSGAAITTIKHRVEIPTLAQQPCRQLALNDVAVCNVALGKPIAFDTFERSRELGGFILVDRFTHDTVAAGLIRHTLRRAHNVSRQALTITRPDRERLNGHAGHVIWFTGLSGSGKSTIANALEKELHAQGRRTYILDGDNVRQGLNKDLGFTEADRVENIRRIAEVARLMLDAGLIVIAAFISPFRRERQMVRELIGPERFTEVYVSTPLAMCEQRDPKGLYRKARAGQIPNMTGINSPYEEPERPAYEADSAVKPLSSIVADLLKILSEPHEHP